MVMRMSLLDGEIDAVRAIISRLPDDKRTILERDLVEYDTECLTDDRSSIVIIPDRSQVFEGGQQPIGPEGRVVDADGEWLSVVLYEDKHGHLRELEIIRDVDGEIIRLDWSTFTIDCS